MIVTRKPEKKGTGVGNHCMVIMGHGGETCPEAQVLCNEVHDSFGTFYGNLSNFMLLCRKGVLPGPPRPRGFSVSAGLPLALPAAVGSLQTPLAGMLWDVVFAI